MKKATWPMMMMVIHRNDRIHRPQSQNPKRVRKGACYRIPESLSAFCRIVSLTAAKTSRIFVVSVACVRLSICVSVHLLLNDPMALVFTEPGREGRKDTY
jgi:hypothetical protein